MAAKFTEDGDCELSFTESNERCLKCVFIVLNEFPKMLQAILHNSEMPATTMYNLILNDKRFKKKLSREDHNALQSLTLDNYYGLDVTLIFKILTNYTNIFFDPPTRGWDSTPSDNETKIGDDVLRLRNLRNRLFHKFDASIDEAGFIDFFSKVKSVSTRIDSYLVLQPDQSFEARIQTYEHQHLNSNEKREVKTQYEKQKGIYDYFVLQSGETEYRVYTTKSFNDFITEIRSSGSAVPLTGPITLIFPDIDNPGFAKVMDELRDEINKGLVTVKIESVKDGSLIIQIALTKTLVSKEQLVIEAIKNVLLECFEKQRICDLLPASNNVFVSMDDSYLPSEELTERPFRQKTKEAPRRLQMDLLFQRDVFMSNDALRHSMTTLLEQIGSKVNWNHSPKSPIVSVIDFDKEKAEDMASPEDEIKKLKFIYDSVRDMITCKDYDDDLKKELETACPGYMTVLETAERDLLRNDCGIVVAGETSAGKSTLINILVKANNKKPIFKSGILAATAAITRIRNMDGYSAKTYTKDDKLIHEVSCKDEKELRSAIKTLTDMEKMEEDMKTKLHFLDVHLPVPILKGNAIIVDTPGVGENKNLDSMLLEFLPQAVAFIFVVNVRNAGGITGDRLGNILRNVVENRRKMPCFDMKDALFLTNCWDLVEADAAPESVSDSDTSDEEDEVLKLWRKVKRVISESWVELPEENIFRVSLKQKNLGIKNLYTDEYGRFESKLNETIALNMNKRIQYYLQFIEDFHKKAITGTLARLQVFERSEEEHKKIMWKNQEKIYRLGEECKERRKEMEKHKRVLVEDLSRHLNAYLQSEKGRDEILNPPDECGIGSVSLGSLSSEVERRIKSGISRWCKQEEARQIIQSADSVVKRHLDFFDAEIKAIEVGLLGFNTLFAVGISVSFMFEVGLTVGLLAFPISFMFALVFFTLLSPFLAAYAWWYGADYIRDTVIKNYNGIMATLTLDQLMNGFENSIGKEFDKIIADVFDDTLPKKIENFSALTRKLQDDYKAIKAKRESIMRMKARTEAIGEQIKSLKKKHALICDEVDKKCFLSNTDRNYSLISHKTKTQLKM